MPAWTTSELRELVCVPIASSASRITTSCPAIARARAAARPTTPAPTTRASSLSTEEHFLEEKRGHAAQGRERGHGPRAAVEGGGEPAADQRADAEAERADERHGGARRSGEGRDRGGHRVRHGERRSEKEQEE